MCNRNPPCGGLHPPCDVPSAAEVIQRGYLSLSGCELRGITKYHSCLSSIFSIGVRGRICTAFTLSWLYYMLVTPLPRRICRLLLQEERAAPSEVNPYILPLTSWKSKCGAWSQSLGSPSINALRGSATPLHERGVKGDGTYKETFTPSKAL